MNEKHADEIQNQSELSEFSEDMTKTEIKPINESVNVNKRKKKSSVIQNTADEDSDDNLDDEEVDLDENNNELKINENCDNETNEIGHVASDLDLTQFDENNNFSVDNHEEESFCNQDLIVCGMCQADFRLSNIIDFIEHKINKCLNHNQKSQDDLLKNLNSNLSQINNKLSIGRIRSNIKANLDGCDMNETDDAMLNSCGGECNLFYYLIVFGVRFCLLIFKKVIKSKKNVNFN